MYTVDDFEWDANKAAHNLAKHGVSFEEAWQAFNDEDMIDEPDDRFSYGEERLILTGMVGNCLLVIVYTERGKRFRLISARKATKHEWNNYHREKKTRWRIGPDLGRWK